MDFFDELEKIVEELGHRLQAPDDAPVWQNMLYILCLLYTSDAADE